MCVELFPTQHAISKLPPIAYIWGTFVLTRMSLVPFHSIMFYTPFAALRVVCLCVSYCAGKFRTLTRISLLNAVC